MEIAKGTKRIAGLIILLVIALFSGDAYGIVRHPSDGGGNSFAHPSDNIIGKWGSNASCVAIAPDLVITTCHQGGGVGTTVNIGGGSYKVSEVIETTVDGLGVDFRLAVLAGASLSEYAEIYSGDIDSIANADLVIGGWGKERGEDLLYAGVVCEYIWSGQRSSSLMWCTNICDSLSQIGALKYVVANFTGPDSDLDGPSTAYEGIIAEYDSGGGWFVKSSGKWKLVGLSASVERGGQSRFRRCLAGDNIQPDADRFKAVNVAEVYDWINGHVEDHMPNSAPYLTSPTNYTVTAGNRLSFTLYLDDNEGDSVNVTCTQKPGAAAFEPSSKTFAWVPGIDEDGNYTAGFTASDGRGGETNITISIVVVPGNRAPQMSSVSDKQVDENGTLSFTVSATDPDGDDLTYSKVSGPGGVTVNSSTGQVIWNTDYDDAGDYSITVSVSDGALTDSTVISVTVNNSNRAPVISEVANQVVTAGDTMSVVVSATDPDGDGLTYSKVSGPGGVTVNSNTGQVSWVTGNDDVGSYSITVSASDGELSDSKVFAVTVNGGNRAPVISEVADQVVTAGDTLSVTVSATDADGDGLSYSKVSGPDDVAVNSNTGQVSWVTGNDDVGSYSITVSASDGELSDSTVFAVTVNNGNRAPVISEVADQVVTAGDTMSIIVSATDADGDALTYSKVSGPSGVTVNSSTGQVSWVTGNDDVGSYSITVSASDGELSDSTVFAVTVNNGNQSPQIVVSGNTSIKYSEGLALVISVSDPDGDNVSVNIENLPVGALYSEANSTISWITNKEDIGDYTITVKASDGEVEVTELVKISIIDDPEISENQAPVFVGISPITVDEGELIVFVVQASDPDEDKVSIDVDNLPAGAVFVNNTFTWQTGSSDIGSHSIKFVAFDGELSSEMTVVMEVEDVNYSPVAKVNGNTKVTAGNILSLTIDASDADEDELTYTLDSNTDGIKITGDNIIWNTAKDDSGTHKFTLTVSDGQESVSIPVTITVIAVNQDEESPFIVSTYPDDGSIQIPLNPLITVTIADYGDGVDYESVRIEIDGEDILEGTSITSISEETGQVMYSSKKNKVVRTGNSSRYTYQYQAEDVFDYDYSPEVVVYASDLNGNEMAPYRLSFTTEMFSMAAAVPVDEAKGSSTEIYQCEPAIAVGDNNVVWSVWCEGEAGSRTVKFAPFYNNLGSFDAARNIMGDADMASADIAVGSEGELYFAWQEKTEGNWDIYIAKSSNGISIDTKTAITEEEGDQTSPVIISGKDGALYAAYVSEKKTGKDIYIVKLDSSLNVVSLNTVCASIGDQDNPVLACGIDGDVYIAWEDSHDSKTAVYAASQSGSWQNYLVASNASEPDITADSSGEYLHAAWNANNDIYYCKLALPLNGKGGAPVNVIDDSSNAVQNSPSICHYSDGNKARTIVSWTDSRNAIGNDDNDIYIAAVDKASMTNILATVDTDLSCQSSPAIAAGKSGAPYILFQNISESGQEIQMASATIVEVTLSRKTVTASEGGQVGVPVELVDSVDDVSITVPEYALASDVEMTIAKVSNPPADSQGIRSLFSYDFGPSSTREFRKALTVVIPYPKQLGNTDVSVYWFNPQTGSYSQSGMSGIETISINSELNAIRFNTTHFSQYSVSADFIPWMTSSGK